MAGTEDRYLLIIGPTETVVLDMERVVAIMPIKKTFLGRIDGSLNLGFSFTSADSILNYSLESDATYRQPKFNASIRREIITDFTVDFPVYDSYDSDPPPTMITG